MKGAFAAFILLSAFAALVFAETDRCSQYGNCGDCAFNSPCGWSRGQGKCMSGLFGGSQDGSSSGSDWVYAYDLCAVTPTPTPNPYAVPAQVYCAGYGACEGCTGAPFCIGCTPEASCGWSISQAKCLPGTMLNRSLDSSSSGADWIFSSPCTAPTPTPTPEPSPTPASAQCTQGCDREYDPVIAHYAEDLATQSYSSGIGGHCGNDGNTGLACTHGYGNCLGACADGDEACVSQCNGAMQQCCYQNSVTMMTQAKNDCKRRCAALDVPVSAVNYDWPGGYVASITSHGDVTVEGYNRSTMQRYPTTAILPGTSIMTHEGSATITFTKPGSNETPITLNLYSGTWFVITAYGKYEVVCEGAGSGRALGLSSEHGSIRGTINGGGCFICGADGEELRFEGAEARLDVPPIQDYGKVEVSETRGAHTPEFVLEASLPGGFVVVNSTAAEGTANYSVEPEYDGITVDVGEGAVRVSAGEAQGSRVLQAGETEFLLVSDLAPTPTPGPTGTPHTTATPGPTGTPEPGPSPCVPGFVLLLIAGGVLAARRVG